MIGLPKMNATNKDVAALKRGVLCEGQTNRELTLIIAKKAPVT